MAQYGDSQNSDLSRFQRYSPRAESASQGQPVDGNGFHQSAVPEPPNRGGNGYSAPSSSPPDSAPASFTGGLPPHQANDSWMHDLDDGGSQRLSSTARKRNQWRQFQSLRPDFGESHPVPEAPAAPAPPRASLPSFTAANHRPKGQQPGTQAPGNPIEPPVRDARSSGQTLNGRPSSSSAPQSRFNLPNPASTRAMPAQPQGTVPSHPQSYRLSPRSRPGQPPLQAHPHSTRLPKASPQPAGKVYDRSNPLRPSAKVAPLRPVQESTPGANGRTISQAAGQAAEATAMSRADVSSKSAQPARPRRRLAKPPMPVLYLIRLVILGVGVAAIAGTLLSVLSPSNLATTDDPENALQETAAATGALVAGTTASLASDVTLTQELTRLKAEIEQLATLTPGLTQSAFMVDLDTGNYVDIAGEQSIAAASTIKVPILVAFLQQMDAGNIALNQGMVLQEEQVAGGSGTMQNSPVGTRYTAWEVATQMITTSDNTATNMMIDALGGMEGLNQQFQAWGLEATVLRNPLPDLEGTNTTSTRDLTLLIALVDQGGLLTPRSRDRMFSIMQRTVNRRLIPYGIDDDSILANKTGDIGTVLGDVALVDVPNGKRYAIATLVERPDNDGRASELIRRTAETAHAEFSQPIAPVGGTDPSAPEDSVPSPPDPEQEAESTSPDSDSESPPNREDVPQG